MILALLEHEAGVPTQLGADALAFAAGVAASVGADLRAVALGPGAEEAAGPAGLAGAGTLHVARTGQETYAPRAWAHALADLVGSAGPQAVVAPGSERGNEVMAYLAAATDLPLATNCTEAVPGAVWRLVRSRWAGSLLEDAELEVDGPKLLTVALGATPPAGELPVAGDATVEAFSSEPDERDRLVTVAEQVQPSGDGVSLSDARVIVSGGRGVGGEDGFRLLEELAGLLGGTVGCSRVVTSEGWRPHRDQVGQTGTRVSPDLYIACGISGAIQHMVGCKGARKILAINTDADAPIMTKADYSVVGDLHAVLPAIVAELRRVRASGGA